MALTRSMWVVGCATAADGAAYASRHAPGARQYNHASESHRDWRVFEFEL